MNGYGLIQLEGPNGFRVDWGTVTSVTDSLNKQIAVTEIVSLPTDCTFALEAQTSNTYTINFTRRNPYRSDGSTYESDPMYTDTSWMWTNARWVEASMSMINRWQAQFDGYTLSINVARNDYGDALHLRNEYGADLPELQPYTDLFPVTFKNAYIKSITYSYAAGDTDTISGTLVVVIGGRKTFKAATSVGNRSVNYRLVSIEKSRAALSQVTNGYVPLYSTQSTRCYNEVNEYTEYIQKSEKVVTLSYSSSGAMKEYLLLKGNSAIGNTDDPGKNRNFEQEDFNDELNVIDSYSIQGGPTYPFESITLKVNMKRLAAEYPEIIDNIKDGTLSEAGGYQIIPGVSQIYAKGVGYGTYVVTEYKSTKSSMTIKGYCQAALLTALSWPGDMRDYIGEPTRLFLDVLKTTNYGLTVPYTSDRIISNIIGKGYFYGNTDDKKTQFRIKVGANLWQVLGNLAMICGARMFFTSEKVFIIDYTEISATPDEGFNTDANYTGGNRLWIRDGVDYGYKPDVNGQPWGDQTAEIDREYNAKIEELDDTAPDYAARREALINECTAKKNALIYSCDSLELHNIRIESRIGGRVNGEISCPTTSEQSMINSVSVKYADMDGVTHTFKLGPIKDESAGIDDYGEIYDGEISTEKVDETKEPIYAELMNRGQLSYEDIGEHAVSLDLTAFFERVSMDMVRAYAYNTMKYHLDPLKEVNFTLAENYSPQPAANEESDSMIRYAFWSPVFPKVCAVKRFTDVDQDLVVSSLGRYDDSSTYRSEKTYLTSYTYTYPEQQSEYTFGEITPISLANNTTKTNVLVQNR